MDYLASMLYLVLAWAGVHLLLSFAKKGNESKLPPGPPPLPIVGNLFSLGSKPHISLAELAKKYGPIMTLQLGHVPTVIISSADIAKEALQKNNLSFSNRMVLDGIRALGHHKKSIVWLPVASQWRNLRKICNTHVFSISRLDASQSLRRNKVKDLLKLVEKSSEFGEAVDISQAAFTTALNLLASTFFSVDLGDPSSEFAREFKKTTREMIEEFGKPNIADYFPILQKIDPQGIRSRTSVHFEKIMNLYQTMIDQRLQDNQNSLGSKSDVLDSLLCINQEKTKEIESSDIPNLLLDLFTGGTDTTSSTLEWAMAELLNNPEKLKKAKAELHEIIGKGNPLEEPDTVRLPYLQAVVKETLRLHPPVPFLVPRKVDSDAQLSSFTVPKNAQVLINAWAIGRDPNVWENQNSFEPERFLGSHIDFKGHDFELIPFGAGRRICPGLPLAIRMLYLMLGSLINRFDWKLEGGVSPGKMNMEERFGISLQKAQRLHAIPDLFAAGTDTTSSTIEWAMAELLKNPEKLKKAQQELHQTVGKENPLKESDITHLPYLQAIVKETLRLHPAVPFLVPRKVESDIKLFGFTVPKNAQVLVNVWAIGRDPDVWERPESFEPERFLGSEIDVKGCDFELIPFGAGRRICPGLPLAIRIIPLILGSLIHGFDWKLEDEVSSEKMDMEENFAFTLEKNQRLRVIPVPV